MVPKKTIIYYDNSKVISSEYWCVGGRLHREDGPAKIWYYEDGRVAYKEWRLNGVLHREDGPVCIRYYEDRSDEQIKYINHAHDFRSVLFAKEILIKVHRRNVINSVIND